MTPYQDTRWTIERFGYTWETALELPRKGARYSMPQEQANRPYFRLSGGELYSPVGTRARVMAPEVFVYTAVIRTELEDEVHTNQEILQWNYLKGVRALLWATDQTRHMSRIASLASMQWGRDAQDFRFTVPVSLQFSLESPGWLEETDTIYQKPVVGNATITGFAGVSFYFNSMGNMDNYQSLSISLKPGGGDLLTTVVEFLSGITTITTLNYDGTVDSGETLVFDFPTRTVKLQGVYDNNNLDRIGTNKIAEWGYVRAWDQVDPVWGAGTLNAFHFHFTGSATTLMITITYKELYGL